MEIMRGFVARGGHRAAARLVKLMNPAGLRSTLDCRNIWREDGAAHFLPAMTRRRRMSCVPANHQIRTRHDGFRKSSNHPTRSSLATDATCVMGFARAQPILRGYQASLTTDASPPRAA